MNQIPAAGKDRHSFQSPLLGEAAVDEQNHCAEHTWVSVNPFYVVGQKKTYGF